MTLTSKDDVMTCAALKSCVIYFLTCEDIVLKFSSDVHKISDLLNERFKEFGQFPSYMICHDS